MQRFGSAAALIRKKVFDVFRRAGDQQAAGFHACPGDVRRDEEFILMPDF